MRDELAGRLLDRLVDWTDDERAHWVTDLRRLAGYKYDEYEGFSAGERFFERLARWLSQVNSPDDIRAMLEFVLNDLVFISRSEMNHAISCVYPHHVKRRLISSVADELSIGRHKVARITATAEFKARRRQTLYLGLSDGARLDRLRRSNHELSHEQFWLTPELGPTVRKSIVEKLRKAMSDQSLPGDPVFRTLVLIDDFYGSGTSLIDYDRASDEWSGKLKKARQHLHQLIQDGCFISDPEVLVIVYVASAHAERHIRDKLRDFEAGWDTIVVQSLPSEIQVTDATLVKLCEWFFDPVMADGHKGSSPLGYKDVALPVVLHHNTPNNSISLLWADSEGVPGSRQRVALFPRYERHHADRP